MKLLKLKTVTCSLLILFTLNSNAQRRQEKAGSFRKKKVTNNQKNNIGNHPSKVNVDKSRTKNNVNVENSHNRNTLVINNNRPYRRPPYAYGGKRYYCYHPYAYHPYRPYSFGPMFHPWGFFITTLAVTAIVISLENQQYHYDQGIYYSPSNGGYVVVQAPIGAIITTLPANSQTVVVNETVNNYYYGGTYYEKTDKGYTVVPPTAGTIIDNLPEGAKEEKIGNQTYMKLGETYYQPINIDGKNKYEVVKLEQDK